MNSQALSPREDQIVGLATEGLTNEAIAIALNLSVGTVNTYWQRVRMKVGGLGRTDTVARVVAVRADERKRNRAELPAHFPQMDGLPPELRAALALIQLANDQVKSTVWSVDRSLTIQCIANVRMPSTHGEVAWEVGKTVGEIFESNDPNHPAIAAHLLALKGEEHTVTLNGRFKGMIMRTVPLLDSRDESVGCVAVVSLAESPLPS